MSFTNNTQTRCSSPIGSMLLAKEKHFNYQSVSIRDSREGELEGLGKKKKKTGSKIMQGRAGEGLCIDLFLIIFVCLPSVSLSVFIQGLGLGMNHTGAVVSSLGFTPTCVHRIALWRARLGRFSLVLVCFG